MAGACTPRSGEILFKIPVSLSSGCRVIGIDRDI